MIAAAPGKLVLSGAYVVLEGAPAIVTAVDRYVRADSAIAADFVTDEVRVAIEQKAIERAPWFDASALRSATAGGGSRKIGLGSSAAILVASLAANLGETIADESPLRAAVLERALTAHRTAQGGGSGVDVAASVHGGVLVCRREGDRLEARAHTLPREVVVEVFASGVAASTRDLLASVRAFAERDPRGYAAILGPGSAGASAAIAAESVEALLLALDAQIDALAELGRAAGAPIVTEDVAALRQAARAEGGVIGPSGAGGGDIAIFVGGAATSADLRDRAARVGLERLDIAIGARGVHLVSRP